VQTAAAVLGLSRTAAYELIRVGGWPTPVLRLGRLIRVPTAPLLALLGVEEQTQGAIVANGVERQAVK
jgi:predicted DNA-binding transcriptional regulator AlpA